MTNAQEMENPAFEYDIFVPTVDASGAKYGGPDQEKLKKTLVDYFGGLTDTRHRNEGQWKVGGITVRDEIVVWRILSDKGEEGDAFLRDFKAKLKKILNQKEILIVRREVFTFSALDS